MRFLRAFPGHPVLSSVFASGGDFGAVDRNDRSVHQRLRRADRSERAAVAE